MFFVEARYHTQPSRAGAQVRYIAHREPGLHEATPRKLWGIGERYRGLKGDETAIRRPLREDGKGLRRPVYFRFILTVDNPTAARFRRFEGHQTERILRDAVERTFRGAMHGAQGVFAVHQHGGLDRPTHPHVHALLSPRFENGMAVHLSPVRIQRLRGRWEHELLWVLQRQERRMDRPREALARLDQARLRQPGAGRTEALVPWRRDPRPRRQMELFARRAPTLRALQANPWTRRWLWQGRRRSRWQDDPERAAKRAVFHLATRAMPRGIREAVRLLRSLERPTTRGR
jgi:hypothetical protein